MTDAPVDLDKHRGMAARKATESRRRLRAFQIDQAALRQRQEAFERHLFGPSADTWSEVAVRAQYLIELFATTSEARDPRRKRLIERTLEDLARLCVKEKEERP